MDWSAVTIGVAELLLSFILGLMTVWLAFRWFSGLTREMDEMRELKQNNTAVGILLSSVVLATALIVRKALYPSVSTWQTLFRGGFDAGNALLALGITLFSFVFSAALALAGIWSALRIFLRLTRDIDELNEIGRNNSAAAMVLGMLIVVMGLFLSHGVQSLLSAIIPMPSFERIQVMGSP